MKDYFNNIEQAPEDVQSIVYYYQAAIELGEFFYQECQEMAEKLEAIGWTIDYDLSAEPFNLRPLRSPGNRTPGRQTEISSERSRMSAEHKNLIQAHNSNLHGLKLNRKKGRSDNDLPLFFKESRQTKLF